MGLATGAKTSKMKFGHHGANHPVQDLDSGRVMITSQNHGFQVDETSLPANVRVTHRSLFDHTVQGIALTDRPAFSFQGHPEASPGPNDVAYLFDRFYGRHGGTPAGLTLGAQHVRHHRPTTYILGTILLCCWAPTLDVCVVRGGPARVKAGFAGPLACLSVISS